MYLSLEQVCIYQLADEKAGKSIDIEILSDENQLIASENKEICQKYRAVELSFKKRRFFS